jgi:hypothetical protein
MLFGPLLVPAIPAGDTGAVDASAAGLLCHNLVKFGGLLEAKQGQGSMTTATTTSNCDRG